MEKAKGFLFIDLDSDDFLPPDFMSNLFPLENIIKKDAKIAGIISLKADSGGHLLGTPLPCEDSFSFKEFERRGKKGEYALIFKTGIARQYPFPVISHERYMPENVVYDMFERYDFVAYNIPMTICEYQPDGLSSIYSRLLKECPGGFLMFHRSRLESASSFRDFIHHAIYYNAFAFAYGSKQPSIRYEGKHRWLVRMLSLTRRMAAKRIGVL